jgi:hypothetical protein
MSETSRSSSPWLFGPWPDLFFGCGLLYVLVCLVFAVDGGSVFQAVPLVVPAVMVAVTSMPHYGATLLRVYDRREDRRGYFVFSVVATVALLAVAGVALFNPFVGSILATVYLTWSGWHYTGQNYGIASMFLRRRGVEIDGLARRLLHTSFTLSFLVVFLVMHGEGNPLADPTTEVRLIPLDLPSSFNGPAIRLTLAAWLATSAAWIVLLARRAERMADLIPTLLIAGTQALWWSIPYAARYFDWLPDSVALGWDSRSLFFPWIACSHALQYLWITSYYARSSKGWSGQGRYYAFVLLAGSAVWTLPALALAPSPHAFDWNFALLLAATVNIHHFILDGAIWKLRSNKIARVLVTNVDDKGEVEDRSGNLRKVVWAVATVGLLFAVHGLVERFVIEASAQRRQDWDGVAASLDRQSWHGNVKSYDRYRLGRSFDKAGRIRAAIKQLEMSADMEPRVESVKRLISLHQKLGNPGGVVRSCDRLFELDSVRRPMPTPDLFTSGGAIPGPFMQACATAARNARPLDPALSDRTGGAGQDGSAREKVQYE